MSAESATIQPAAPAAKRFQLDQRYLAPLLITGILMMSQRLYGVLVSPRHTLTAIAVAIATEVVLGKLARGKVPHLSSAYITGISVGILLHTPDLWPFAVCAAISIASKYALRWEGRHLWNPSNFGICAMLVLAHDTVATLSQQWDNRIWAMLVIWVVGSVIIARLRRFHICATYVAAFVFFAALRGLITGHGFLVEVAPLTGPMYQLFTFFMITDPGTTVRTRRGQIVVAFCVAAMEHLLRTVQIYQGAIADDTLRDFVANLGLHAPYFALFTVGPLANALEIWKTNHVQSPGAHEVGEATAENKA